MCKSDLWTKAQGLLTRSAQLSNTAHHQNEKCWSAGLQAGCSSWHGAFRCQCARPRTPRVRMKRLSAQYSQFSIPTKYVGTMKRRTACFPVLLLSDSKKWARGPPTMILLIMRITVFTLSYLELRSLQEYHDISWPAALRVKQLSEDNEQMAKKLQLDHATPGPGIVLHRCCRST